MNKIICKENKLADLVKNAAKKIIFMAFLCFVPLAGMINVSADEPAEQTSYQIEFENGAKIFYMYPTSINDENGLPDDSFLKSGLYRNTEPPENIYVINSINSSNRRYFYQRELVFSDDGIYFANMPWTDSGDPGNPTGIAIEFYNSGILRKKYVVADLVEDNSKLIYTSSHVFWENNEKRSFDAANNILSVVTKDGIMYKFDLVSGNIIDKENIERPNSDKTQIIAIAVGAAAFCILILILLHRRTKK